MRLLVADCTVDYVGRLTAHLPEATRLILFKADGSVSIHADDRAYKPLNWMSPPCFIKEENNEINKIIYKKFIDKIIDKIKKDKDFNTYQELCEFKDFDFLLYF